MSGTGSGRDPPRVGFRGAAVAGESGGVSWSDEFGSSDSVVVVMNPPMLNPGGITGVLGFVFSS